MRRRGSGRINSILKLEKRRRPIFFPLSGEEPFFGRREREKQKDALNRKK